MLKKNFFGGGGDSVFPTYIDNKKAKAKAVPVD